MDEFIGHALKRVRGLGFAASVFTTSLAWTTRGEVADDVRKTLLIWVGAYVFHRLGRILDSRIYDPLFGADGRFRKFLDKSRSDAESQFDTLEWKITDLKTRRKELYKTSEMVFEDSGVWGEKVELALELSKAARTFVLPLFGLFIWDTARGPLPTDFPSWLADSSWVGSIFVLSLLLYLGLRVMHNLALYGLVASAQINVKGPGIATIETLPKKPEAGKPSYRFYCEQVPHGAVLLSAGRKTAETQGAV
jgi:hypothetical protein